MQYAHQSYGSCFFNKKVYSWAVMTGSVPVHTFPVHMIHFVANMYKDAALYKN